MGVKATIKKLFIKDKGMPAHLFSELEEIKLGLKYVADDRGVILPKSRLNLLLAEENRSEDEKADIVKEQISKREKYLKLQKKLSGNGELDENSVDLWLDRGMKLWNDAVETAKREYKNGKVVVIYSKGENNTKIKTTAYYSVESRKTLKFTDKTHTFKSTELYNFLNTGFAAFCNKYPEKNKYKPVFIATGEGGVLQDASHVWIDRIEGLKNNIKGISFLSGPIMICKNNDYNLNEFARDFAVNDAIRPKLKLYRNRIISFTKLYAGYFHFYVIGDNIFAETPHAHMNDAHDSAYRLFINDAELAKEFRSFAESYINEFAVQFPQEKLDSITERNLWPLEEFYGFTFNTRIEKLGSKEFEDRLRDLIVSP